MRLSHNNHGVICDAHIQFHFEIRIKACFDSLTFIQQIRFQYTELNNLKHKVFVVNIDYHII